MDEQQSAAESFGAVYSREHDGMVRLAFLLTADREAAADLSHDAWVAAYRRHERRPLTNIGAYVRTSLINGARSRGRRQSLERVVGRARPVAPPDVDPTAGVTERSALLAALEVLPVRMRTAVVLRHYADLSVAQAAREMGISEGAVKSATARGLERLREAMNEEENADATA
ncbi:SigE family RNA polymerase sigma factor [Euzebya rosea]|uniref:SigE family RNA polymerase sigma factor n=1 Tax=Euzebya rosea TaxID=2052804 RepID=UPI0013002C8D|nr:SigE family RNA polymerase sigma factor [Euzebya rosea]